MKQKMTLQLPASGKPRNPVCVAARQRHAGVHDAANPARHERRQQKQRLQHWVKTGGELE